MERTNTENVTLFKQRLFRYSNFYSLGGPLPPLTFLLQNNLPLRPHLLTFITTETLRGRKNLNLISVSKMTSSSPCSATEPRNQYKSKAVESDSNKRCCVCLQFLAAASKTKQATRYFAASEGQEFEHWLYHLIC